MKKEKPVTRYFLILLAFKLLSLLATVINNPGIWYGHEEDFKKELWMLEDI